MQSTYFNLILTMEQKCKKKRSKNVFNYKREKALRKTLVSFLPGELRAWVLQPAD